MSAFCGVEPKGKCRTYVCACRYPPSFHPPSPCLHPSGWRCYQDSLIRLTPVFFFKSFCKCILGKRVRMADGVEWMFLAPATTTTTTICEEGAGEGTNNQ